MKAHVLLAAIALMVVSCNQYKTISLEEYQGFAEEIGLELPDSLKTEEQIAIKEKMMEIIITNTTSEKNLLKLNAKRKDFIEAGLPEFCYDMAMFDIEQSNIIIKQVSEISEVPINLEESLQEAKKEFSNNLSEHNQ